MPFWLRGTEMVGACGGEGFVDADSFVVCSTDVGGVLEWTVDMTRVVTSFGRGVRFRGEGFEIWDVRFTGPAIAGMEIDVGTPGAIGG